MNSSRPSRGGCRLERNVTAMMIAVLHRWRWALALCPRLASAVLAWWGLTCLAHGQAVPWLTPVCLKGQSSGGVLCLASLQPNTPSPYVAVTNHPGDKAETVLKRLAAQLARAEANYGGNPVSRGGG